MDSLLPFLQGLAPPTTFRFIAALSELALLDRNSKIRVRMHVKGYVGNVHSWTLPHFVKSA
jgi:hypothetical protein